MINLGFLSSKSPRIQLCKLKSITKYLTANFTENGFNKSILTDPSQIQKVFDEDSYENRTIQRLIQGLKDQRRSALAESITLVESTHHVKKLMGQILLQTILSDQQLQPCPSIKAKCGHLLTEVATKEGHNSTLRIGITGPPGAGKSTFIETFGLFLVHEVGLRVAVLAIDPSSSRTGGSLLGDKTRMAGLSLEQNAYVRPTSARGVMGGVGRNTTEALMLCESAGYDVVIVETVGVGQSEVMVADMTDLFLLLIPPAGGDELQGLKRGIVENVDLVLVNKSDGDLLRPARLIQTEYTSALKFIPRRRHNWHPVVSRVSSLTSDGISDAWKIILRFYDVMNARGELEEERRRQRNQWMLNHLKSDVFNRFRQHPSVDLLIPQIMDLVDAGIITPGIASDVLLNQFFKS